MSYTIVKTVHGDTCAAERSAALDSRLVMLLRAGEQYDAKRHDGSACDGSVTLRCKGRGHYRAGWACSCKEQPTVEISADSADTALAVLRFELERKAQ